MRPRRVDDKPVLEERPVDAIMALPRASAMTWKTDIATDVPVKEEARQCFAELTSAYPDLTISRVRAVLLHTPSYLDRATDRQGK